jgi:Flp pilus assembly pilin Flp
LILEIPAKSWNQRLAGGTYVKLSTLHNLPRNDSGQDLIGYVLVAALIAIGAIAAMNGVATGISNTFSAVASDLNSTIA